MMVNQLQNDNTYKLASKPSLLTDKFSVPRIPTTTSATLKTISEAKAKIKVRILTILQLLDTLLCISISVVVSIVKPLAL